MNVRFRLKYRHRSLHCSFIVIARRSVVHVLLSLLLLFTQQLGATHVYSHWSGAAARAALAQTGAEPIRERGDGAPGGPSLAHRGCAHCLSLAQIAVAIGSPILTLAASPFTFGPIAAPATLSACLRTVCVFQPRAPPPAR